ncbi:MAG TPA: outer membrane beta-barrel family protein [Ignavibacteriaceae bacterium]|nr:outer membrane beta-barrel family protein [Ignavibacteriaceae bacterium]
MKIYFVVLVLFLTNIIVSAQNKINENANPISGFIKGKVIDSSTKKVIDFANVSLFSAKDSSVINGTVSNGKGEFIITNVRPGKYYVKISFVGYKSTVITNINITSKSQAAELGLVSIVPSSIQMSGVVVRADKEMIVTNLDKQVINVDKDLVSSSGSALDVMQNIPAIQVDIDGNISLRGNSNVTILVDGKPSGFSGLSSNDVLTQIPANSIQSVEVVTNPSSKYDPDGTAGIINIVLKKKSNPGFNGVFNLNAGTGSKYNGTANFNYRTGDLNFFGDIGGRFNQFNRTGLSDRTNTYGPSINYLDQTNSSKNNFNMGNFRFGTEYMLNDFNTISGSVQYRRFYSTNSGGISNYQLDSASTLEDYFLTNTSGNRSLQGINYSLDYTKDFEQKGRQLTADIMYLDFSMNSASITDMNYLLTGGSPSSLPSSSINNTYANSNKLLIIQSNYVQPFGKTSRLEAGFKSSIRNLGMDYNYFNYDPSGNDWINNLGRSNNFSYQEQIHAIYAIYTGSIGGFKFQGGLRGEDAITKSTLLNEGTTYNSHYYSLYPSIYFAYDFSPVDEFRVSYTRRVDRPKPWNLNPFINYSDSLNLSKGNPNLMPQYTDSYEMGYSSFIFNINVYAALFLKQTTGLITRISTLQNNGVTMTTFQNIASQKNYGSELVGNGRITSWWDYNANVSYFRTDISDPVYVTGVNGYSYSWTGRANTTFKLDKTLSFQVSYTYNSPTVTPQGRSDALYFTDLALKKDFMDGNLSVTLRATDIFNTRKYSGTTYGTGFSLFSEGQRDSRIYYLGISYNLNNFKNKDKVKDIPSDDEMNSD